MGKYPIRAKLVVPISLLIDDERWTQEQVVSLVADDEGVFRSTDTVSWTGIDGEITAWGLDLGPTRYQVGGIDVMTNFSKKDRLSVPVGGFSIMIRFQ